MRPMIIGGGPSFDWIMEQIQIAEDLINALARNRKPTIFATAWNTPLESGPAGAVTLYTPPPDRPLDIADARAALTSSLVANKTGGTFVHCFDDSDPARLTPERVDAVRGELKWLGLTPDREIRRSERLDGYAADQVELIDGGRLYKAFEARTELDAKFADRRRIGAPPIYDRSAVELEESEKDALRAERGSHWRLKVERARVEWEDGAAGGMSIEGASVSDPVLFDNDGLVAGILAAAVDDIQMCVTHVALGSGTAEETALRIQIVLALGGDPPRFAHHSLPAVEGGGEASGPPLLRDLRDRGAEPMAVINLLARDGAAKPVEPWPNLGALVADFDVESLGTGPVEIDEAELWRLTARRLLSLGVEDVADDLSAAGVPDDIAAEFWDVVRDNVESRADIAAWWNILLDPPSAVNAADLEYARMAIDLLPDPPWTKTTWPEWTDELKSVTDGRAGICSTRCVWRSPDGSGDRRWSNCYHSCGGSLESEMVRARWGRMESNRRLSAGARADCGPLTDPFMERLRGSTDRGFR